MITPFYIAMDPVIALNGKILRLSQAHISPFDHGFLYGDGVYETLRTWHGRRVLDFDAHLARLRQSAAVLEIPLPLDDAAIKALTDTVITKNGFAESRVRISLTRGANGFVFVGASVPTLMISATPLADYAPYASGVDLVSLGMERVEPEIKSISLLPMVIGKRAAQKAGAFDTVFFDREGCVTEGTVFNISFRSGKTLVTAASETVLTGTAERVLVSLAAKNGYVAVSRRFDMAELFAADEVVITNSLFGALPVRTIDKQTIGHCPGELFRQCGQAVLAEMAK